MNNKKYNAVLLSGFARSGKDTFFELLSEINPNFVGFSFAYELKNDLFNLVSPMGINIHHPTDEQKRIIRNLMISYGCAWREINLNHWVEKVDKQIEQLPDNCIPVIRDNRFINESEYFINKYGRDKVLIVEIVRPDGPTPPKEELENQPKITAIADCRIVWDTDPTFETLREYVGDFYRKYFQS